MYAVIVSANNEQLAFGRFVRGVQADLGCSEERALEVTRALVYDRTGYTSRFGGPAGRSTNVRSLLSGALLKAIERANKLSLEGGSSLQLERWTTLNKSMREAEKLLASGISLCAVAELVIAQEIYVPLFQNSTPYGDERYVAVLDAFWERLGLKVHAA